MLQIGFVYTEKLLSVASFMNEEFRYVMCTLPFVYNLSELVNWLPFTSYLLSCLFSCQLPMFND